MGPIPWRDWCSSATAISTGRPIPAGNGVGAVFRISPSGTLTLLHSCPLMRGLFIRRAGAGQRRLSLRHDLLGRDEPHRCRVPDESERHPDDSLVVFRQRWDPSTSSAGAGRRRQFLWHDFPSGSGYGTVFKISPTGSLTNLWSFTGGSDGGWPVYSGLVQLSDGNFYGMASQGGSGYGTVFKISPAAA